MLHYTLSMYASRAGEKLKHALDTFHIILADTICADFGCSTGGFVDCMLKCGASRIYAVDTGYGVLDWKLRNNPKVVLRERTNAMHIALPEKVDFISIDVSWTKQSFILPNAMKNIKEDGVIVSLIKPHYEAQKQWLKQGRLLDEYIPQTVENVKKEIEALGLTINGMVESPIQGEKGKNREFLIWMTI